MEFRELAEAVKTRGDLLEETTPVSKDLDCAAVIQRAQGRPVRCADVGGWSVVSNLLSTRDRLGLGLGLEVEDIADALDHALSKPKACERIDRDPPCQQVVIDRPDLDQLPVLKHYAQEGGPFVTAGVMIVEDPDFGLNAAYHRLMQVGPDRFTARLVEGRGTDTAYGKAKGPLPAAVCIGPPVELLFAAAVSADKSVDETAVANTLNPFSLAKCRTSSLFVPATSEWVLEGRLLPEHGTEGPFVDITRTLDGLRRQPVFEVGLITHRTQPLYHAVLPGGAEHQVLMGIPRELAVLPAVKKVVDAVDFHLTAGGCAWLDGVLVIRRRADDDGTRGGHAALAAHPSMKIVTVVDEDVDPRDADHVAWAVATRFQPGRDLVVLDNVPSSSLDPSAVHPVGSRAVGSKMIIDATVKPMGQPPDRFGRIT